MYLINLLDKGQINYLEELYSGYVDCFYDLFKKKRIITICAYKEDFGISINDEIIKKLETKGIFFLAYNSLEELASFVKQLKGKIYVNTFKEQEILNKHILKKLLGQKTTENPNIFLDKFLQRSIIGKDYPDTMPKHILLKENENILIKNFSGLNFPLIIKPVGGTASFGVQKVNDMKELVECIKDIQKSIVRLGSYGLDKKDIVIEEYIEGQLYAITYFVDEEQNIYMTKPILQGDKYENRNPMLMYGVINGDIENHIEKNQIKKLINETVKGGEIRNTFVCHQFKKTPDGKLKTIELNGRIGGFNIEMYKHSYGINFFDFVFDDLGFEINNEIIEHSATFWIYADEEVEFRGYKETILHTVKNLNSLKREIFQNSVGSKVGPPQLGYYYYGIVLLTNKDEIQFNRDFNFVKENYFNLLKK